MITALCSDKRVHHNTALKTFTGNLRKNMAFAKHVYAVRPTIFSSFDSNTQLPALFEGKTNIQTVKIQHCEVSFD